MHVLMEVYVSEGEACSHSRKAILTNTLLALIIQEFLKIEVPVVTGSGNDGDTQSHGYPARFALSSDQWGSRGGFDNLIVVGSVNAQGEQDGRDLGNWQQGVHVYAPGYRIACPTENSGWRSALTLAGLAQGTSY